MAQRRKPERTKIALPTAFKSKCSLFHGDDVYREGDDGLYATAFNLKNLTPPGAAHAT